MALITNSAHPLKPANEALTAGEHESSQGISAEAPANAKSVTDLLSEAKALSVLADYARLLSKYRRAHIASQRAAHLFRLAGDVHGEVSALTTLAHAASNLGRNEEAVEAALLSVRLAEKLPPGLPTVMAHNYLGVAYLWSRNWERARMAFDEAIRVSEVCVPPVSGSQPFLNQCMGDLLRLYEGDLTNGQQMRMDALAALAKRLEQGFDGRQGPSLSRAAQSTQDCMSRLGLAIVYLSLGEVTKAPPLMDAARVFLVRAGVKNWMSVIDAWARAELALKTGDFVTAEKASAEMVQVATDLEHEQLAHVGLLIRVRIAVLAKARLDAGSAAPDADSRATDAH